MYTVKCVAKSIENIIMKSMKKLLFVLVVLVIGIPTDSWAQSDSIRSVQLPESTIIADKKVETPTHTVIIPTSSDKAHSANAFDMIHSMNLSGLEISYDSKQIFNNLGQEVVLCIDGIEVSANEVAVLRSKDVKSMEFQRNPTGKYLGKGGVLNFKTVQYNYSGNVYLSAKESFLYNSGEYLAATDYTRKKSRLSLIYSNDWDIDRSKQKINNQYYFANGDVLVKQSEVDPIKNKSLSNTVNLRYSNTGESYRFSLLGAFSDAHVPYSKQLQQTTYAGSLQDITTNQNTSDSYGNSFLVQTNYTRWLPRQQIIDLTASASSGRNKYNYHYQETQQEDIRSQVKEDNLYFTGTFQYYKTFDNGLNFSALLNHYYTKFNDNYGGSIREKQTLANNVSMATLQLSKSTTNIYYYLTTGISNMNAKLNGHSDNYLTPTGYYGITYTPGNKTSLSINGFYVHTYFDPSYKNNISMPTSFFEVRRGNPNLKPIKVFSNTLEFNRTWNTTSLTASYMNYIYFDNIVNVFESDDSHIYTSMANDGNFYGNMLAVTLTQSLFNDKLKLSLEGVEEYNKIKGPIYDIKKNVLRGTFKVDYTINQIRFGTEVSTPYKTLDIRVPFIIKERMNMSLYSMWDWKNWRLEAGINNLFSKYSISERLMGYPCFDMKMKNYGLKNGRSITLKAVYNFSFGKKSEKESFSVERFLNSAILRTN